MQLSSSLALLISLLLLADHELAQAKGGGGGGGGGGGRVHFSSHRSGGNGNGNGSGGCDQTCGMIIGSVLGGYVLVFGLAVYFSRRGRRSASSHQANEAHLWENQHPLTTLDGCINNELLQLNSKGHNVTNTNTNTVSVNNIHPRNLKQGLGMSDLSTPEYRNSVTVLNEQYGGHVLHFLPREVGGSLSLAVEDRCVQSVLPVMDYYEITIERLQTHRCLAVGFASRPYPYFRLPGTILS
jgi:hypothetical protein